MDEHEKFVMLLAEDDDDDVYLVKKAMEQNNLHNKLKRMEDGEELILYLKGEGVYSDRKTYPLPSLLLLDLNMPRMDGREALKMIKSDPDLRALPVIIFSTSQDVEDITAVYSSGTNSYIRKPPSFAGMVETMKTLHNYWLKTSLLPPCY